MRELYSLLWDKSKTWDELHKEESDLPPNQKPQPATEEDLYY
jgi:hypothetical protein